METHITPFKGTVVFIGPFLGFHVNPFPLIINDVPPLPVIINIPGGQKIFIIRGEYLLKGFGRAAFKFLLKSNKIIN